MLFKINKRFYQLIKSIIHRFKNQKTRVQRYYEQLASERAKTSIAKKERQDQIKKFKLKPKRLSLFK